MIVLHPSTQGRDRTLNNWTRTSRVAGYTTRVCTGLSPFVAPSLAMTGSSVLTKVESTGTAPVSFVPSRIVVYNHSRLSGLSLGVTFPPHSTIHSLGKNEKPDESLGY